MNRRGFLLGSASAVLCTGASPVAGTDEERRELPAPPPGSDCVSDLMRRCTACNLCISRCPSNVLRAAGLGYGLGGVMMPRMDFTHGFCRPDCNECGKACPAGAIRPFRPFEKKEMRQAIAVYRKTECLVAKEGLACGNCVAHCPYGAIAMVKDGDGRSYPKVDPSRCTGCGACEYHCPAKAIRVVGRKEEPSVAVPEGAVRDVPRIRSYRDSGYQFCNVGSNTGVMGFDWAGAGVKGVNLATGPQALQQGFQILEWFAPRLAKGCVVVIPICPFSSVLPHYEDAASQFKIYPFARQNEIPYWSPARARAVEAAVRKVQAEWDSRGGAPVAAADAPISAEGFRRSVEELLACWRSQFEIKDFNAPLTPRNQRAFAETVPIMREGLEMCVRNGWRPVVVLPPISRHYDGVFKPVFWKTYVADFMAAANSTGAPYWDYGADERFRGDENFANSLMLNRKGRALFTAEIIRRIREDLT